MLGSTSLILQLASTCPIWEPVSPLAVSPRIRAICSKCCWAKGAYFFLNDLLDKDNPLKWFSQRTRLSWYCITIRTTPQRALLIKCDTFWRDVISAYVPTLFRISEICKSIKASIYAEFRMGIWGFAPGFLTASQSTINDSLFYRFQALGSVQWLMLGSSFSFPFLAYPTGEGYWSTRRRFQSFAEHPPL